MREYIITLLKRKDEGGNLNSNLDAMEKQLSFLQNDDNVILLGGYKGLLHSILLGNNYNESELTGGVFIDYQTALPHGLAKVRLVSYT